MSTDTVIGSMPSDPDVILDATGLTFSERVVVGIVVASVAWALVGWIIFLILRCTLLKARPPRVLPGQGTGEGQEGLDEEAAEVMAHGTGNLSRGLGHTTGQEASAAVAAIGTALGHGDEPQEYTFCYQCAAMRLPGKKEEADEEFAAKVNLGVHCSVCEALLVEHTWIPQLVMFFTGYDNDRYDGVNPAFPLAHFVSRPEVLTFLVAIVSALINVGTITWKVIQVPDRDTKQQYNLILILLPALEAIGVWLMFFYMIFTSARKLVSRRVRRVRRPIRTFFAVFTAEFPTLANVNSIGLVKWWDISDAVDSTMQQGYVRSSAPEWVNKALLYFFLVGRVPFVIFIWLIPAVAIFVRLLQLAPTITEYVGDWTPTHWITFLSFLNNIRSIAQRPPPLSVVTKHLIGSRMAYPFIDIADTTAAWFRVAILQYTSTPQEIYRIFVSNADRLFLAKATQQAPAKKVETFSRAKDAFDDPRTSVPEQPNPHAAQIPPPAPHTESIPSLQSKRISELL